MEHYDALPSGYGPDDEVDHGRADPIWVQVAAILAARIETGRYRPGRLIPSTRRVAQELEAAVGTVRSAVRYLEERGIVRVIPGRGVAVEQQKD